MVLPQTLHETYSEKVFLLDRHMDIWTHAACINIRYKCMPLHEAHLPRMSTSIVPKKLSLVILRGEIPLRRMVLTQLYFAKRCNAKPGFKPLTFQAAVTCSAI